MKNYKELFSDPQKAEQTATNILNKIPAFQKFTQQNSILSKLFASSSSVDSGQTAQSLAGLQTKNQIQGLIQQKIASGGPNAAQSIMQNIQLAQAQLSQLKDKLLKSGGTSGMDVPEGFNPNMQKTKTFLQRIEYGANVQFAKSTTYIPTTCDIALTIGYKLTDKDDLGIGLSYNIGATNPHIALSSQGVGFRSFIDWEIKKQVYLTGGFEMTYNSVFTKFSELQQLDRWQQSGLIGLTKKLNLKSKYFKSTNIQILYDMLYDQHIPKTQPLIFRTGYNF